MSRPSKLELKQIDSVGVVTRNQGIKYPYLHWCHEWDGMLIDDSDPEFDCCLCYPKEDMPGWRQRGEEYDRSKVKV